MLTTCVQFPISLYSSSVFARVFCVTVADFYQRLTTIEWIHTPGLGYLGVGGGTVSFTIHASDDVYSGVVGARLTESRWWQSLRAFR